MPKCKHCGVELSENTKICPLCNQHLQNQYKALAEEPVDEPAQLQEHSWFWEFTTFMVLAAAVVVFTIDFVFGLHVTWSRFPLASLGWVWLIITAIRFLNKRPVLLISSIAIVSLGLLWFLAYNTNGAWFAGLALPLVIALALASVITVLMSQFFRCAVQSILAIAMLMSGVFLVALEALVTNFVSGSVSVSWSLVVFACVLPLTGFLLVMHRRLKRKGFSFRKFFHA